MIRFRNNISINGEAFGRARAMAAGIFEPSGPPSSNPLFRGGAPQLPGQEDYETFVERNAAIYENRVRDLLVRIQTRQAGRAVMSSIGQQARRVTIVPLPQPRQRIATRRTTDSPNSYATPLDLEAATQKSRLLRDARDGEVLKPWRRGTGEGSDGEIEFHPWPVTPDVLPDQSSCRSQTPFEGSLDEDLLHELLHVLRYMLGVRNARKVPFQPLYDTMEEFFAIVITNIYRSECGREGIRQHHHEAPASCITDEGFLKVGLNREHLRKLRRQQPDLFADLHTVKAPFNPIRQMWVAGQ